MRAVNIAKTKKEICKVELGGLEAFVSNLYRAIQ